MGVPVERFDPFQNCDLSELPEAEKAQLEAAPHEFAVALGLAQTPLAPAAFRLDVVPEAVRKRRDFATKGVFSVAAGAAALAALGVLYAARKDATAATEEQRRGLTAADKVADAKDTEFRKAVAQQEEVQAKHRLLAELAAPGPLLSDAMALLEAGLASHPEVYLSQVTLVVEDPIGGYTLVHPKGALATGYVERPHSRAVRTATVRVIGKVSPGPSPDKVFNDFVQTVKSKDKRLIVTTRKTFTAREGVFELEIAPGVMLHPTGVEKGAAWVLRTPTYGFGEGGAADSVTGISVDGVPVTLRKEQVEADDWKDLTEAFPPSASAASEKKE
jgi:hypothetical protein